MNPRVDGAPTRYRDRETGRIETERVFGGDALRFLYGGGRPLTDLALTHPLANAIYGWVQRGRWSRKKIGDFVSSLGIDAGEAERPLDEYRSLDDFFTRRLRPGVRPIDRELTHLVSPADGRVLAVPRLGAELRIKGAQVVPAELLGDRDLAGRYTGGAALVVRLAPADYHRFHFPDGGVAGVAREIPGRLHSVHPIALAAGAPSFRNRRAIASLDSERFGRIAMVEVGALLVGGIVQTYVPGPVERGQEKGYFRMGGSTVVLLFEPGRIVFDADLVESSAGGLETLVRVGTRVGRAP